jgi:hypothetical protein
MLHQFGRKLLTFCVLLIGSCLAGFWIATIQHLVTFGVRGYGFGRSAFHLAGTEGGFLGILLGIPTGLVTYYGALEGHVSIKQVILITLGSLVAGCIGGLILDWPFAFGTPVVTICIAVFVRIYAVGHNSR